MLAAVNDNAALGDGVQIFAAGPNCCTVCAPTSVRKSDVEACSLARRAARIDPCLAVFAGPIMAISTPDPAL